MALSHAEEIAHMPTKNFSPKPTAPAAWNNTKKRSLPKEIMEPLWRAIITREKHSSRPLGVKDDLKHFWVPLSQDKLKDTFPLSSIAMMALMAFLSKLCVVCRLINILTIILNLVMCTGKLSDLFLLERTILILKSE